MSRKYVIDTSVWISHLLLPGSIPSRAVQLAEDTGGILVSPALVLELQQVLCRPKFQRYITQQRVSDFLKYLVEFSAYADVTVSVDDCRDPNDNQILALALSGGAGHIITGDADLLCLHPYQGIAIVTPRQFVEERVEGEGAGP